MNDIIDNILAVVNHPYIWIIQTFLIIFATLLLGYFVKYLFKRLKQQAQKTKNIWDNALIDAAYHPAVGFIWLLGILMAANVVATHADTSVIEATNKIREVGIIALATWFLLRVIRRIEAGMTDPEQADPVDKTTAKAISKLLRASVFITALLIVMQSFGYSVSGILAFGGIGGLAVGFAAKDLLANFFGGAMIYLDRPFKVGDWIRSPDRNIEGVVEDIGWRLTRIRTFEKRPLYVPNATFNQIALENPSRMLNRRIYETVGIRYDDVAKMSSIIEQVKKMLKEHPELDPQQTIIANFNSFAASSLDFFIYAYTKTTDWVAYHGVKQDVMLKVIDIIESHGAECAFPTSTLHIQSIPEKEEA